MDFICTAKKRRYHMNPWKKSFILGLAPMDGVTDVAFRFIVDKYGKPDLLFTEFVSTDAVVKDAVRVLNGLLSFPTKTPTIAQLFGTDPRAFYLSTLIVCALGFDGVDINMGCPDRSISKRGAGAGLIKTPETAKLIVKSVKQAVKDWSEGKVLDENLTSSEVLLWIDLHKMKTQRVKLPVSIKTRIGFDTVITSSWISNLTETQPDAVTIHGRTLAQMYTGKSDWDEIGKAAHILKSCAIPAIGSGDLKSKKEAFKKIIKYNLNGALIGRASFGNPWVFSDEKVDDKTKLMTAIEHCEMFTKLNPGGHFISLRKHLAWYCKGFRSSAHLRNTLMKVKNEDDVKRVLTPFLN